MKSITMKEIAGLAGVSCATVSRALNGGQGVSEELRERIFLVCRQEGYRKNLVARRLSAARSGLIGCVLSDMNNPLFSDFALVLEQAAYSLGFQVMFCQGRVEDPDFSRVMELLIGHRADGVILVSSSQQVPETVRLYADKVPIVVQGTLLPGETHIPSVMLDCVEAGCRTARYLFGLGHRRAVFLGLRENNGSILQRWLGFQETAAALGMSVRAVKNGELSSTTAVGHRLGRQFFYEDSGETAVFAASDGVAMGFLAAAREFCVSVPEEISVVGFDNISQAAMRNVRLTTFDPGNRTLAEQSLRRLLDCLDQEESSGQPLLIPPVFVERATCAPPPTAVKRIG